MRAMPAFVRDPAGPDFFADLPALAEAAGRSESLARASFRFPDRGLDGLAAFCSFPCSFSLLSFYQVR